MFLSSDFSTSAEKMTFFMNSLFYKIIPLQAKDILDILTSYFSGLRPSGCLNEIPERGSIRLFGVVFIRGFQRGIYDFVMIFIRLIILYTVKN